MSRFLHYFCAISRTTAHGWHVGTRTAQALVDRSTGAEGFLFFLSSHIPAVYLSLRVAGRRDGCCWVGGYKKLILAGGGSSRILLPFFFARDLSIISCNSLIRDLWAWDIALTKWSKCVTNTLRIKSKAKKKKLTMIKQIFQKWDLTQSELRSLLFYFIPVILFLFYTRSFY
jgi:hypothetical protein